MPQTEMWHGYHADKPIRQCFEGQTFDAGLVMDNIGISQNGPHIYCPEKLERAAYGGLYQSKSRGKNRIIRYEIVGGS